MIASQCASRHSLSLRPSTGEVNVGGKLVGGVSLRPVYDSALSCSGLGHGQRAGGGGSGDFGDWGGFDAAGLEGLLEVGGLDEAGGDE